VRLNLNLNFERPTRWARRPTSSSYGTVSLTWTRPQSSLSARRMAHLAAGTWSTVTVASLLRKESKPGEKGEAAKGGIYSTVEISRNRGVQRVRWLTRDEMRETCWFASFWGASNWGGGIVVAIT
jgi:hypothetical protein